VERDPAADVARWHQRGSLEDGDVVTLTASAAGEDGARIGFGRCADRVPPALP